MTRKLVLMALALAIAATATPALAKSKKHRAHHPAPSYAQPYAYAPYPAAPFVSRNVSDPSFGNRTGINYARSTGRCVEDLGYGRWEYCGW